MTARLTSEATSLVDALAGEEPVQVPKRLPSTHKAYQASQSGCSTHIRMRQLTQSKSNPAVTEIAQWLQTQARLALERRPMMRGGR